MKKTFLGTVFVIILIMSAAGQVAAESNPNPQRRVQFGMEIQDYQWKEFDDNNIKLVDETGYLYGLTCDFDSGRDILGWRSGISLFGGEVDYEGVTWSLAPVKTDAVYIGTQFYGDIVPNYRLECGLWLKTFAGIGFKGWLRDLDDTQTQEGVFVSGAEEWWWSVYGRMGAGASYPVSNTIELFSETGTKIPIYSINHADLYVLGSPSIDLKPEMRFSPFVDMGVRWNQFVAKISYDTLWFDKSDSESASGDYVLHQPESEAEIITFSIAWIIYF
jgi:hypothetical protein